jgi:death-on-curing protein
VQRQAQPEVRAARGEVVMRFDEVLFLDVDDVLEAHDLGIERFGGTAGLRDRGLLESAVMVAQSGYYGSLAQLAAVYAYGIAMNHPFVDGNKRAALSAAGMFLNAHGFDLQLGMEWVAHMENVAARKLSRDDLIALFVAAMGEDVSIDG